MKVQNRVACGTMGSTVPGVATKIVRVTPGWPSDAACNSPRPPHPHYAGLQCCVPGGFQGLCAAAGRRTLPRPTRRCHGRHMRSFSQTTSWPTWFRPELAASSLQRLPAAADPGPEGLTLSLVVSLSCWTGGHRTEDFSSMAPVVATMAARPPCLMTGSTCLKLPPHTTEMPPKWTLSSAGSIAVKMSPRFLLTDSKMGFSDMRASSQMGCMKVLLVQGSSMQCACTAAPCTQPVEEQGARRSWWCKAVPWACLAVTHVQMPHTATLKPHLHVQAS